MQIAWSLKFGFCYLSPRPFASPTLIIRTSKSRRRFKTLSDHKARNPIYFHGPALPKQSLQKCFSQSWAPPALYQREDWSSWLPMQLLASPGNAAQARTGMPERAACKQILLPKVPQCACCMKSSAFHLRFALPLVFVVQPSNGVSRSR